MYSAKITNPEVSAFVVSFVRVVVNLALLVVPALFHGEMRELFGDKRPSLWLRGLFGGLSLMLFFVAIQMVGSGEATFLQSSNGMFIVLIAPLILSERFSFLALFAIIGSVVGMYFLTGAEISSENFQGIGTAIGAGFFSALSNIMVAKSGKGNTPASVVFYFCFVSFFLHLGYFFWNGFVIPQGVVVWLTMILVGVSASAGQIYLTKAYQYAPSSLVTAVGYIGPVFTLAWSVIFFERCIDEKMLLGCGLILLCGIALPFFRNARPELS